MMEEELEQSRATHSVIEESANLTRATLERHRRVATEVTTASGLVSTIKSRVLSEQFIRRAAISCFALSALYVLYSRI